MCGAQFFVGAKLLAAACGGFFVRKQCGRHRIAARTCPDVLVGQGLHGCCGGRLLFRRDCFHDFKVSMVCVGPGFIGAKLLQRHVATGFLFQSNV